MARSGLFAAAFVACVLLAGPAAARDLKQFSVSVGSQPTTTRTTTTTVVTTTRPATTVARPVAVQIRSGVRPYATNQPFACVNNLLVARIRDPRTGRDNYVPAARLSATSVYPMDAIINPKALPAGARTCPRGLQTISYNYYVTTAPRGYQLYRDPYGRQYYIDQYGRTTYVGNYYNQPGFYSATSDYLAGRGYYLGAYPSNWNGPYYYGNNYAYANQPYRNEPAITINVDPTPFMNEPIGANTVAPAAGAAAPAAHAATAAPTGHAAPAAEPAGAAAPAAEPEAQQPEAQHEVQQAPEPEPQPEPAAEPAPEQAMEDPAPGGMDYGGGGGGADYGGGGGDLGDGGFKKH